MFDIGWPEMMVIALVTLVVIGPREIPNVLRTISDAMRRMRQLAQEFHRGLESMSREAGVDKAMGELDRLKSVDFEAETNKMIDPDRDIQAELSGLTDDFDHYPLDPTEGSSGDADTTGEPGMIGDDMIKDGAIKDDTVQAGGAEHQPDGTVPVKPAHAGEQASAVAKQAEREEDLS